MKKKSGRKAPKMSKKVKDDMPMPDMMNEHKKMAKMMAGMSRSKSVRKGI